MGSEMCIRDRIKYEFCIDDLIEAVERKQINSNRAEYLKAYALSNLLWIHNNISQRDGKYTELLLKPVNTEKISRRLKLIYPVECLPKFS